MIENQSEVKFRSMFSFKREQSTHLFVIFLIINLLYKLYFINDFSYVNMIYILKNYTIESLFMLLILLIFNMYRTGKTFDDYKFLRKYKPFVNNLKQMHFYKRKTCVIKDGKIHRFSDSYE